MSVKVTIIKSGNRNVRFETERNLRTTPVSQEGRESAAEAREELKIPAKPIRSMLAYTARNIVKKQGVSMEEALEIAQRQNQPSKKRRRKKKEKKGASRTVYSYGGKAVKSIVSGGGPGTGKRR